MEKTTTFVIKYKKDKDNLGGEEIDHKSKRKNRQSICTKHGKK